MNNLEYLNKMKLYYNSLNKFNINNNILYFYSDKIYTLPLYNTILANLNPNLFLLNPNLIFQILYMNELAYKNELTEFDIEFIRNYIRMYFEFTNNKNENNQNILYNLEIPINNAYLTNTLTSQIIIEEIDSLSHNGGLNNHPRLVLKKNDAPNYEEIEEEYDYKNTKDNGFVSLMLIISFILISFTYISIFIISK